MEIWCRLIQRVISGKMEFACAIKKVFWGIITSEKFQKIKKTFAYRGYSREVGGTYSLHNGLDAFNKILFPATDELCDTFMPGVKFYAI